MQHKQERQYNRAKCIVFRKTQEAFGGLSNMASGFPLTINRIQIRTSEALYQACRFPHYPDIQKLIIGQASPMTAKMKSKRYRNKSRNDWTQIRLKIMRWCLQVKLAQNYHSFGDLLLSTGNRPIVEESRRDNFWGAQPVDEIKLVGWNVLGRLLMELREELKQENIDRWLYIEPLKLKGFLLMGQAIKPIQISTVASSVELKKNESTKNNICKDVKQMTFFNKNLLESDE